MSEKENLENVKKEEDIIIIEKNIHRTNLRRLIDTLYLFVPIALAFGGCIGAAPLWIRLTGNSDVPESFRFACSVALFALAVIFVFIKTRKINPIMKIGIFSRNDQTVNQSAEEL